jgi:phage shock protein A
MAESIFVRVQNILSTGAESAVGAAERLSGTSLMRAAIRDVNIAADELLREIEAAKTRRLHAERQQEIVRERLKTLDEQARFAMSKGRDDLAEAAVARQLDYETQARNLKKAQAEAAAEGARLAESLAALKVRRAQMEKELAAVQSARHETPYCGTGPTPIDRSERKVARAEETFERAMAAAGVPGPGLMDAEEAAKLAEVDALRKDDAIAQRLAALRAAGKAAPAGRGAKKRPAKKAKPR